MGGPKASEKHLYKLRVLWGVPAQIWCGAPNLKQPPCRSLEDKNQSRINSNHSNYRPPRRRCPCGGGVHHRHLDRHRRHPPPHHNHDHCDHYGYCNYHDDDDDDDDDDNQLQQKTQTTGHSNGAPVYDMMSGFRESWPPRRTGTI